MRLKKRRLKKLFKKATNKAWLFSPMRLERKLRNVDLRNISILNGQDFLLTNQSMADRYLKAIKDI